MCVNSFLSSVKRLTWTYTKIDGNGASYAVQTMNKQIRAFQVNANCSRTWYAEIQLRIHTRCVFDVLCHFHCSRSPTNWKPYQSRYAVYGRWSMATRDLKGDMVHSTRPKNGCTASILIDQFVEFGCRRLPSNRNAFDCARARMSVPVFWLRFLIVN